MRGYLARMTSPIKGGMIPRDLPLMGGGDNVSAHPPHDRADLDVGGRDVLQERGGERTVAASWSIRGPGDLPVHRHAGFLIDFQSRIGQIRLVDLTGQLRVFVREIQVSEAKAHLASLLDAVERGETIIITRHGKPIARIVPEADLRRAEFDRVIAEIEEFRGTMPRIPLEELLSARHEGHKY